MINAEPAPERVPDWQVHTLKNAVSVLYHCLEDQLEATVRILVANDQWETIELMLKSKTRTFSKELRAFIVENALSHTSLKHVRRDKRFLCDKAIDLLLLCSDGDHALTVLTHLTHLQCWWAVKQFFVDSKDPNEGFDFDDALAIENVSIDEETREWVVRKACVVPEDGEAAYDILPLCLDRQLDMVIGALLQWKHWTVIGKILREREVSDSQLRLIISVATEGIDNDLSASTIFTHCRDKDQIDRLMDRFMSQYRLSVVADMLFQGDGCESVLSWMARNATDMDMVDVMNDSNFNSRIRIHNPVAEKRNLPIIAKFLVGQKWEHSLLCVVSDKLLSREFKEIREWLYRITLDCSCKENCPVLVFLVEAPDGDIPGLVDRLVLWDKWDAVPGLLGRPSVTSELRFNVVEDFFDRKLKPLTVSGSNNEVKHTANMLLQLVDDAELPKWLQRFVELEW
jgi:hypothetical protein